jgi:hypothetical protein
VFVLGAAGTLDSIDGALVAGANLMKDTMGTLSTPSWPQKTLRVGDLWTVSLAVAGDPSPLGWGGRVIQEHFPIEVWPKSTDCPLPGVNDSNWYVPYSGAGGAGDAVMR